MKKIVLMMAAAVCLIGCGKKDAQVTQQEAERVEVVGTITLQEKEIERVLNISTNLQGYVTQNVAPSLTGKIEHIFVEVGDKVNAGDMLVRMDQTQYLTQKIQLANLEIEVGRLEALLETGSVSQQTYDQTKVAYDQLKQNLAFLEQNTYVKAPFDGVISAKTYEDGELYGGQPIVVLTQVKKLKALIAVPETYYPMIKEGMKLTVKSEVYPNETFPATIEVVYPTIDAASHTFQCKVVIPNASEKLRGGMYVTTTLGLGKENTIVVPYQSVEKLIGSNERYVFINENGYAKRVSVKLGQRFDENIEIIAPEIKAGVEYISVGQHKLVDGVKIRIANEK
ncbi:MAG: efflux RND transporter periplasmic adaptor subunit [Paludibacteraceae bacterium]|nr:efflux RND transporter periplasmic adaptor subunit [Paludibacteraceae bacterium]